MKFKSFIRERGYEIIKFVDNNVKFYERKKNLQ